MLRGHIFVFYKIWSEENWRNAPLLSLIHFNFPLWSDKGETLGKPAQQLVYPFAPKAKTKRILSGGHLRLVAIWDLP